MSDLTDEEIIATRKLHGLDDDLFEDGADTNVGSINKNIERCEKLIKPEHANWIGISNQKAIRELLNILKEKDKEIDLMAGYIATLDIEEDICSKIENEHCDKMNFGECEDCIKQYFKSKATNDG